MKGFLLELDIGARDLKKTRMMGLPGRERSLTIFSAVWNVNGRTDRQTDGRTSDDSKDRAYA